MKKSGDMWVLDDDKFIGGHFGKTGDRFQIEHLEKAMEFVSGWGFAVDGGAHYGSWSRYMAKRFEEVIAFEPVEGIHECAVKNTAHLPNVLVHQAALGATGGMVSVGPGKHYSHPGTETVVGPGEIPMVSIDEVSTGFPLSLGLLKLDIEGYEYHALIGARDTLIRCKPVVIFEENVRGELEHGVEPGSCGGFLKALGAKLVGRIGSDHIYAWGAAG